MTAAPEKKGKRAFFIISGSHQDPDHLDVPPAHARRLKLSNSLKTRTVVRAPLVKYQVPGEGNTGLELSTRLLN